MGKDYGKQGGGLLDSLLDDASAAGRAEQARAQVVDLVGAVRSGVKLDAERDAAAAEVEAAKAAARAAEAEKQREANRAVTGSLIGAVVSSVRKPREAATEEAAAGRTESVASRIRRPTARFGADQLLALPEGALLTVVTRMEPLDLVQICASRGAGDLTDRLLALLPEGTRQALFEAIKTAGITEDEDSRAALERAQALVSEITG